MALALACLQGCASAQSTPAPPPADPQAALWRDVTLQLGDAACDSDSQCRVIGVGAKACGGPTAYLPWSTKANNETALRAAVDRHAQAQRAAQAAAGMASNCMHLPEPAVQCRPKGDGRKTCQTTVPTSAQ